MLINRNKSIARLQELKGDSTGLVASVFDTCIQAVREMDVDPQLAAMTGALKTLCAQTADACEYCIHYKALLVQDCEDADCNCEICKANCGCGKCRDGSNFVWRNPND